MQLSSLLDRFFYLDIPVIISAAGVPARPTDERGGRWHDVWSPATQARWAARLFALGMSKPFVESIFWSDLYDHERADLPGAGLIDSRGRPRPVLQKLIAFRHRLRKPLGPLRGTSPAGQFTSS